MTVEKTDLGLISKMKVLVKCRCKFSGNYPSHCSRACP